MTPPAPVFRSSLRATWLTFSALGVLAAVAPLAGFLVARGFGWSLPRGWEGAAALLAFTLVAFWCVGGLVWHRRRAQDLAAQRAWLADLVEQMMVPTGQPWDPALVNSPWNIEHAALRVGAVASAQTASDWCLFNRSQMGLLLLEVEAEGEASALQRALVLHLWRALVQVAVPPGRTLLDVRQRLQTRHGVTAPWRAFYAQVDLTTGVVSYAGWGVPGLYILGRGGVLTTLGSRAWGAAGMAPSQSDSLEQGQVTLVEGESLLLFTDALLTLENAEGERFGLSRLQKALRERPGCGPEEMLAEIQRAVEAFAPPGGLRGRDVSLTGLRVVAPYGLASRYEPVAVALEPVHGAEAGDAVPEPSDEWVEAPAQRVTRPQEKVADGVQVVRPGVLRLPPRRDP